MAPLSAILLPLLAAATAVQAQVNTGPVNLPINAQNGLLHFPISCSVLGLSMVFDGVFTGTGPVVGGPGQDLYLTDATTEVTVPSSLIIDLAGIFGVTQASAVVFANFSGTNTKQRIFEVFPTGLHVQNVSIPFGKDIIVKLPANGGALPPIGPLTLGDQPGRAVVFFESISIALSLQNSAGHTVLSNIPVTCAAPNPDIQLFVISIAGPAGQAPLTLSTGGPSVFPSVGDNMEVGSFRFPYSCNFGNGNVQDIDLSLSGALPTYLKPGQDLYITNASSFLRLSNSVVASFIQEYPTLASVKATVSAFYITTTSATPALFNAIKTPLNVNLKAGPGGTVTIAVPETGFLPPVGPITASKTVGDTVFIGTGNAVANILIEDSSGKQIGNIGVTCSPKTQVDFIGFPVSSTNPPTFQG